MSIEKSNDFTSIQCGCGITFNFKAPGSRHRIAELAAENARLRKLDENVKKKIKWLKILPILTNPEERILLTLESLYE
jgi:hypothetical protein